MASKKDIPKSKRSITLWPFYLVLVFLIVLYAFYNNAIIGLAVFLLIIGILIADFKSSVKSEGVRKSVYDIIIAVVGVIVFWIILILILHTTSPVNVVASCSMLPILHRGDIVVLHGIDNMTNFLNSHNISVVQMDITTYNQMIANMNSEFVAFFAYSPSNRSILSAIVSSNSSGYGIGLYNTRCLNNYAYQGQQYNYFRCSVSDQSQNSIRYSYSLQNVLVNKTLDKIVDTSQITINNTQITQNYSNPIIVYKTTTNDYFQGDIIHRLIGAIKVGNRYYLLTKGDNNPTLDIQFSNYPIGQNDVLGYVISDVPILGYLKLIFSGQLSSVPGCNQQIIRH